MSIMNIDRKNLSPQTNAGPSNSGKGAPSALPDKDKRPQGQTAKPGPHRNESKPNKSAGQGADERNDDHDQGAEGYSLSHEIDERDQGPTENPVFS
jgi:hypothetical protein